MIDERYRLLVVDDDGTPKILLERPALKDILPTLDATVAAIGRDRVWLHCLHPRNPMARRELTKEQCREALQAGGLTCPRCGNDDGNEPSGPELEDADAKLVITLGLTCSECSETWVVVCTPTDVRPD